jgi:uncharacterized RDD family membrane protein YckC
MRGLLQSADVAHEPARGLVDASDTWCYRSVMPPRRTHVFPKGRPAPLIAIEVATPVSWFAWIAYAPNLLASTALLVLTYVVALAACLFVHAALLEHYEQTGQAVALPSRRTHTEYGSLPRPVLAVRIAFFVVVAVMLAFGLAPVREATARAGIIATVFALFVLGLLSVLLEAHYVNTGRAKLIDVDAERSGQ